MGAVVVALALAACAQVKPQAQLNKGPDAGAVATAPAPAEAAGKTASASAEVLPEIDLSQKLLYQLMMSEIAAQRGMQDAAFATELSLANETRDPRLARRATEFALSIGQAGAALQAAKLWLDISPNSFDASNAVMTILVASNRLDEAEPLMQHRLNDADNPLQAFAQMHGLLSRSPNRAGTLLVLQHLAATERLVKVPEVHLMLAQSAQNANDKSKAVEELQLASMLKPDWDLATIMLAQYQAPDAPTQAEATLTTYLARHPKSLEVRMAYVRMLVNAMRNTDAIAQLRILSKDESASPEALYALGLLGYQAGNSDVSEGFFNRFLAARDKLKLKLAEKQAKTQVDADTRAVAPAEVQTETQSENQPDAEAGAASDDEPAPTPGRNLPSPNGAYLFLAQIAEDRKNDQLAMDWLARIQDGNEYVGAHVQRARILARQGRLDEGREELQNLTVSSDRERTQLIIAEAQLLREAKRNQEAFDLLTKALQRTPDNPDLLYDHGMAAIAADRLDVMETSLRSLIRVRPTYPHGYNALGYTLADHNMRLPEAKALIEKALSLAPDDPSIIDSMGWVEYRLGNFSQAIEYLQRAYQLRQDADVAVHLGEALWATGRKDEAEKYWSEAGRKEPDNDSLRQTLLRFNVNLGALPPVPPVTP